VIYESVNTVDAMCLRVYVCMYVRVYRSVNMHVYIRDLCVCGYGRCTGVCMYVCTCIQVRKCMCI